MPERFPMRGEWWLPDRGDSRIAGTLRFSTEEGPSLDLIGSLWRLQEGIRYTLEAVREEIILGYAQGQDVTLHGCHGFPLPGAPGSTETSWRVGVVFTGTHFQCPEDIRFTDMTVRYSGLDEWVGQWGFVHRGETEPGERIVHYRQPDPVEVSVEAFGRTVVLRLWAAPSVERSRRRQSIEQRWSLAIEPSVAMSFEEFGQVMHRFERFLALGLGHPSVELSIIGRQQPDAETTETRIPDSLVWIHRRQRRALDGREVFPGDMLFAYQDVSGRLETCLRNWFNNWDRLQPVYGLYFATVYGSGMYLEHRFLNLVHAVESFHRRVFGGRYLDDDPEHEYGEVYDALVGAIPPWVPQALQQRLEGTLTYGAEFSLRSRLRAIVHGNESVLGSELDGAAIHRIVTTRNWLVHYDERLREDAARGEDLFRLCQALRLVVEVCLLRELGLSEREVHLLQAQGRLRHRWFE